jgi:hypothetical protein
MGTLNIKRLQQKKQRVEKSPEKNIKEIVNESFGKISLHGIHFLGDNSLRFHEK